MKGISGETGSLKLYSYETDGSLKEVPAELWHIQTEAGETPDTLSDNILYEVHFTVQDNEALIFAKRKKKLKSQLYLETHKQNLYREYPKCFDCKSMDTICCQFLITRFSRHTDRIHVILVNDTLGY